MKHHMEERWTGDVDEDWWDDMREHMEERWEELEDGDYRYGGFSGFGGCSRWLW
jgi:hypothetical protein